MNIGDDGLEGTTDGPTKGIRLQTLIARSGVASRRAAEKLMIAGRVRLNGRIVTEMGSRALPDDVVEIDGLNVKLKLKGACGGCPHATMTIKQGIQRLLREQLDEGITVEQVV